MANKTKLELTWIGKENRPTLDLPAARQAGPRILREVSEKSYHAASCVADPTTCSTTGSSSATICLCSKA